MDNQHFGYVIRDFGKQDKVGVGMVYQYRNINPFEKKLK